jgi:hypothetical protein
MEKIIMRKFNFGLKAICATGAVLAASAVSSFAAVDLTSVTIDTTTPETLAATILAGLGVIWGIRKLVKLTNRS